MTNIHSTAVVSPHARLGQNVSLGPYCIIEDDVQMGEGCQIAAHAVIKNGTILGKNNRVFESAVLGGPPQHLMATEPFGGLIIGEGNTFREHVTVHRGLSAEGATTVGDHNLLMVNAHVGHDCHVGSHIVMANNVMLSGHVTVADRAFFSGAVGIHQYCRVGRNAMLGGQARITQDVPPFVTVDGFSSRIVGLNVIGLRRTGFTASNLRQLKSAYRVIYRSGLPFTEILDRLRAEFPEGPAAEFHKFMSQGSRGFIQERRAPRGATVKLRVHDEEEKSEDTKGGARKAV